MWEGALWEAAGGGWGGMLKAMKVGGGRLKDEVGAVRVRNRSGWRMQKVKKHGLVWSAMAVMAVAGSLAMAQPGGGGAGGAGAGGQPGERGRGPVGERSEGRADGRGMERSMQGLRNGLRELKSTIDDASKMEQTLLAVSRMQQSAIQGKSAKSNELKGMEKADEAGKQKIQMEYRKSMNQLAMKLLELEAKLMDGKTAEAKAMIPTIEQMRDEMHQKFQGEGGHEGEEKKGGGSEEKKR
jgi:soluble cytochrome b562